ncbi:MAG: hypothetical protein CMM01_12860 [Rhodopirellula sp.]|nr:hypothetical protein [Rhodopirellula sp.]MAI71788.1 hypothetical protein [Rhodopirellula sp.]
MSHHSSLPHVKSVSVLAEGTPSTTACIFTQTRRCLVAFNIQKERTPVTPAFDREQARRLQDSTGMRSLISHQQWFARNAEVTRKCEIQNNQSIGQQIQAGYKPESGDQQCIAALLAG